MKRKAEKSLSVVLRRSVPKLFLILTASIPAIVIPSLVVGKSKDRNLNQVEGQCVSSKNPEPLSKSGRFVVGQKEDHSHFAHLIGEAEPKLPMKEPSLPEPIKYPVADVEQTPVYQVPPAEQTEVPEDKTYEELFEAQKAWEKEAKVPKDFEHPSRLKDIPPPPPEESGSVPERAPLVRLEPTLEITEVADAPPIAKTEQTAPAPVGETRAVLKLFPLHPESYGVKEPELPLPVAKQEEAAPKEEIKIHEELPIAPSTDLGTAATSKVLTAPQVEEVAPSPVVKPVEEAVPQAPVVTVKPEPVEVAAPQPLMNVVAPPTPEPVPVARQPVEVQEVAAAHQAGYLTNYTNLNIKEFIRFISRITNKNFVFNEDDLNFNISMISEKRSTPEELISTLLQQLRIHGLAVIEEGDSYIIHTNPEVSAPATVLPRSPGEVVPNDVQIVTQVFRLNVVVPSKAMSIIKPLLSAQAVMEPLDESGILTLTDLKVNVEKVKDLLVQLDQPSSGLDVSHFKSDYINAETLVALGERILAPIAEGKELRLIPLKDSNMIFIISTPVMVKKAVDFFTALDKEIRYNAGTNFPGAFGENKLVEALGPVTNLNETLSSSTAALSSANTEFNIYKLEFRKGDQIQEALQQIAASMLHATATPEVSNDLYDAIGTVQWIEASNTLVFTGTPRANSKIKDLIKELDISNQQVLIEMLLLDTSIAESYHIGVDWGSQFGGPNVAGAQAFISPASPLPGVLAAAPFEGILNAANLATQAGFSLGVIGRTISCNGLTFSSLGALVHAVNAQDIGRVVLNPKIVVEENSTAEIFVGLNIPFKTQSIANDFGIILTNNFEYRDIGARLNVTPIINKNGIITLEIQQELSTVVASTISVITNSFFENTAATLGAGPTTRKSFTKTTVFVPNNHFVILSGMLQDESERIRTQIPCLGGIPVLGAAFSRKTDREQNRNLIIFIRPTLLNTEDEMTYYTKREQDIYDQKCRPENLWRYEIDEALDYLNINQDHCHR